MDPQRLPWIVALLFLAATAGCMADLERVPLETAWEANTQIHDAPTPLHEDLPAQVLLEGPISIDSPKPVQLTGLHGDLVADGETIPLTPVRATLGGSNPTLVPDLLDEDPTLEDGDTVHVTWLPEHADHVRLPNGSVNLSAELQYRYRAGDDFDAGRFTVDANITPRNDTGLGVGVAKTTEAGVHEIVFKDLENRTEEGPVTVKAFHVSDRTKEEATLDGELERGEGVAIVTLEATHETREGEGFLLFHVDTSAGPGVAVHPNEEAQTPLPTPAALAVAAAFASAFLLRRR